MRFFKSLALLAALFIPLEAFANGSQENTNPLQPYLSIIAPNTLDGVTINPTNTAAGSFTTLSASGIFTDSGGTATQGTVFSTSQTGNPLLLDNVTNTLVSTVGLQSATVTVIIASSAGRIIYPGGGLTIMASGTAATATALALECSDGTLIASWPIADLVSLKPIGIGLYNSTNGTITTGAGLGRGCPASTAVVLSNVGTNITTTTNVFTNIPYTVQ